MGDHLVPRSRFGLMLRPEWKALADRLTATSTDLDLPPEARFASEPSVE
jgi:hypothetical protein